ncbi:MAG: hypothetical protein OJJ54_19420 [Pseudonocardia sp.]|nr:hypothetical protein [Pseudonocardia sp.]
MTDPTSTPQNAEPEDAPLDAEIVPDAAPAVPEMPPVPVPPADYDEHGVPSLDYVRNKIETRAATAEGWQELTGETAAARTAEEQFADREKKGQDKLAEIRRSLGL